MRIAELRSLEEKQQYLDLLLEADPSEEMIMRYLERSRMFLLIRDNPMQGDKRPEEEILGEIVAVDLGEGKCEIKNLMIVESMRGNGLGRMMIDHITSVFSQCHELLVGTSNAGLAFYEACGFHVAYHVPRFFLVNYPQPIWEDGKRCEDMVYLRRTVRPNQLLSVIASRRTSRHTAAFEEDIAASQ